MLRNQAVMRSTANFNLAARCFASTSQEIAGMSTTRSGGATIGADGKVEEPKFLENVQMIVENAAQKAGIKPEMLKYIMACDNVIRFQIPIKRDNGKLETLTCYRAQHKHHFMPVKGGTRYAADMNL